MSAEIDMEAFRYDPEKHKPKPPFPVVFLSPEELKFAAEIGLRRNAEDVGRGLPPGGAFISRGDRGERQHIIGAQGEMAFAAFRGKPWTPAPMKACDVDGYEVRTTDYMGGHLPVRPHNNPEPRYALVIKEHSRRFSIRGWIKGADAMKPEYLTDPGGRGKVYFVPQFKLNKDFTI